MRHTRREVETQFARFVKLIGGHVAQDWNDVGGYRLDHYPMYGGWNIERILNDGGALNQPFGQKRHNAEGLLDMMAFAEDAMREAEHNANKS